MWIIIFSQKTMAFSLGVSPMKMAVLPSHLPNPFFLPRKTRAVGPTWESWHIARPRGWTSNLLAAIRWAPCCTSWDMPLGWHMNKRDPTGRLVLVVIGCDDYSNPKKEVGWSWSDPTKKGDDNYLARFFFLGDWWLLCAWLITCYTDSWFCQWYFHHLGDLEEVWGKNSIAFWTSFANPRTSMWRSMRVESKVARNITSTSPAKAIVGSVRLVKLLPSLNFPGLLLDLEKLRLEFFEDLEHGYIFSLISWKKHFRLSPFCALNSPFPKRCRWHGTSLRSLVHHALRCR